MRAGGRSLLTALAVALVLGLAGCSTGDGSSVPGPTGSGSTDFFDVTEVHTISVELEDAVYQDLLDAYLDDGEKEWVSATVTIDGETFTDVGMRLKGNSTLRSITADAEPQDVPWLIRLDKYVDGQSLDGVTSLVVRASSTETAVNEALAQQLIAAAGIASQAPTAVAFAVNGSQSLRLVVENPDDAWAERTFGAEGSAGLLYKAEVGGDYTYRGDDPAAYDDVFDQEAGEPETVEPLIDFLQWLNESDDATFSAELADHVDVDALVTYLAVQELVGNFDDIDGPGNNSYLHYDPGTGRMTVVSWDENLAFGTANVDGGGQLPGGQLPGGRQPPGGPGDGGQAGGGQVVPGQGAVGEGMSGQVVPGGGLPGRGLSGGNVLTERFLADPDAVALVDDELERLRSELVDSGLAGELLDGWEQTFRSSDLVTGATVESEVAAVRTALG